MGIDIAKYIARGAGAIALGLVARDAHVYGKIKSDAYMKTKDADSAAYYYNNTQTISKPSMSLINMQDAVYKYELNESFRGFINSGIGYFKGVGAVLISDIMPLGLGLAALLAKGKALTLAKGSAIGLALAGVYSFVKNGLGIGKRHDLTSGIK